MKKIDRVLFIGSKKSGLLTLQHIFSQDPKSLIGIITIDDRDDTRSAFLQIRSFASKNKIKLFVARNARNAESIIKQLQPQLCFVQGWYWLFNEAILKSVPRGFLGVHFSLLPKYRGCAPVVWAMINGEKETGVSLFEFTKEMDAGRIFAQKKVNIGFKDSINDVLIKLDTQTHRILKKNYLKILRGYLRSKNQKKKGASYGRRRYPEDGLIDWRKSSREIYNFIRAQSAPYPGAFTMYRGKRLTVWRAEPPKKIHHGFPGQIVQITKEGVHVVCGDQHLIFLKNIDIMPNSIKSVKAQFY